MNTLLHTPRGLARVDSIRFAQWIVTIPLGKHDQAARVARYLAIRANRNSHLEKDNANHERSRA